MPGTRAMLRCLQAFSRKSGSANPRLTPPISLAPKPTTYRLVGHANTPDGQRRRVYIDADGPVTALTKVLIQAIPGRFDNLGQPLEVRAAPDRLARAVRIYLRDHRIADDFREARFEPAV